MRDDKRSPRRPPLSVGVFAGQQGITSPGAVSVYRIPPTCRTLYIRLQFPCHRHPAAGRHVAPLTDDETEVQRGVMACPRPEPHRRPGPASPQTPVPRALRGLRRQRSLPGVGLAFPVTRFSRTENSLEKEQLPGRQTPACSVLRRWRVSLRTLAAGMGSLPAPEGSV